MKPCRLAFINSHPVQYHAPWLRALAVSSGLELEAIFGHRATPADQASAGFNVEFQWDTPLLEGYRYRFLENVSKHPSVTCYAGVDTPEIDHRLAGGHYDAVLVNGWHYKSAWQAFRACWRHGIPLLVRSDSHLHTPRSAPTKLLKWLPYWRFLKRMSGCVAVGRWSKEYFRHYRVADEKIFLIPHVIDNKWFRSHLENAAPRRDQLRRQWGLKPGQLVFLFAAKFIEKKRPLDFVKAIQQASRTGLPVAGLMVGDGPLKETCQRYVEGQRLPVGFAGFLNQSDIITAYAAADVLVLPSDGRETWGLVVNEAMFCGLPCIVSDRVGSGPDMIREDETGWIFPLGDIQRLAELMCSCCEPRDRLYPMRQQARRMAGRYLPEVAAANTAAVLQSVLRQRKFA